MAQIPAQRGHHPAGLRDFLAAELGEVLLAKNLPGAVSAGEVDLRYRIVVGVAIKGQGIVHWLVAAGRDLGLAEAALLAHGAQVHAAPGGIGLAPEHVERLVKDGKVLPAVDEDAAGGLVELAAPPDVDVLGGPHHVQDVGRAGVQPQPPQNIGKAQQVGQDVAIAASTVAVQGVEVGGHRRLD